MKRPGMPRRRREIARGKFTAKRPRIRRANASRKAREFVRCYGSKRRVAWVQRLPCIVPLCLATPCDNAHVGREGAGAGRKANADQIAPLCSRQPGYEGHHRELHRIGAETFADKYQIHLAACAALIDSEWRNIAA
jgi:hypothetical protein